MCPNISFYVETCINIYSRVANQPRILAKKMRFCEKTTIIKK